MGLDRTDGNGSVGKGPDRQDGTLQDQSEPAPSRHIPLPVSAADGEGGTGQAGPGKDRMGSEWGRVNRAGSDPKG